MEVIGQVLEFDNKYRLLGPSVCYWGYLYSGFFGLSILTVEEIKKGMKVESRGPFFDIGNEQE